MRRPATLPRDAIFRSPLAIGSMGGACYGSELASFRESGRGPGEDLFYETNPIALSSPTRTTSVICMCVYLGVLRRFRR
jgi:hypothetical protein